MSAWMLGDFLRTVLDHPGTFKGHRVLRWRPGYAVFEASLHGPRLDVVLKVADPRLRPESSFERAASIMELVRNRALVPTAEVLAVDESATAWPWQYLVTSHVPGRTWAQVRAQLPRSEVGGLFHDLGCIVGQLHTVRFSCCGELGRDGMVEHGTGFIPALTHRARRRIPNPLHAALFAELLTARADLFAELVGGALCHEDLNPHNILVAEHGGQWRVAAILDFESAWAGQAESDLARLELWRGMTGREFWTGYEAVVPVSSRYLERRALYQLLWCLEYARPTPEHNADTAQVCEALGIEAITF
jgi:Ser/Thr protein kinase RdoA (MazF antagonist)